MSNPEIRMFNVEHGRNGDITYAVVCNGRFHYTYPRGINSTYSEWIHCDGQDCQAPTSEMLDISLLTSDAQQALGLEARVPNGLVLVTDRSYAPYTESRNRRQIFAGGSRVTPKILESGRLLADGEGTTYMDSDNNRTVFYVRNSGGQPLATRVGRKDSKRTTKKLLKLRRDERKSEVSYDVSLLNARMQELMQLHRTPEVAAEIENVKELWRLASQLSTETSIEAAEGNEAIARELANSRAREIAAELQHTRERLLLEQAAREGARVELEGKS